MYPKNRRSPAVAGSPFQRTSPRLIASTPMIIRMLVVLPAPFAPTNPAIVPSATRNPTWSTATLSPTLRTTLSSSSTITPLQWVSAGLSSQDKGRGRSARSRRVSADALGDVGGHLLQHGQMPLEGSSPCGGERHPCLGAPTGPCGFGQLHVAGLGEDLQLLAGDRVRHSQSVPYRSELRGGGRGEQRADLQTLSLIHISEPTRLGM